MLMYERTEAVDALIIEFARECQLGREDDQVATRAGAG